MVVFIQVFILFNITENIIQYTAPKGESKESQDPATDLEDVSYDGVLDNGIMRNGLGQLVDGLYGDDDFQRQIHGESSGKCKIRIVNNLKL